MSDSDLLEHSPLGPSAASIWINCTAALKAQEGFPDTESEFAAEGTAAHLLSEWCREENKPADAWLGERIQFPKRDGDDEMWDFEVTPDMVHHINEFLDYVNQVEGEAFFEERVTYDDWVPDGFGTADDIRIADGVCYVTDLKYGKGVQVFAEDNPQLKLYALGVHQAYGPLYDIERYVLRIAQPRLDHWDEWEISAEDLVEWACQVVVPAAMQALGRDGYKPEFNPGPHCKWCRARTTCKARAARMLDLVDFSQMDVEGRFTFDPMEIAELLPHLGDIKKWATEIEEEAVRLLQARQKVGDYKLVEGRGSYSWDDEKSTKRAMQRAGLTTDQIYKPRQMISKSDAEKLLGKKHPILQPTSKKGGHVVRSPGKPTLAPGSDNRKSVVPEIEFDDLSGGSDLE